MSKLSDSINDVKNFFSDEEEEKSKEVNLLAESDEETKQLQTAFLQDTESRLETGERKSKRENIVTRKNRIDPKELASTYKSDAVVYKGVNSYAHQVPRFTLNYPDGKAGDFWKKWAKTVEFESLMEKITKDLVLFGDCWLEVVRNNNDQIVRLPRLPPQQMDYQKESGGKIKLQEDGETPVGYVKKSEKSTGKNMTFEYNKVIHLTLEDLGDGFYGLGKVEPVYKTTMWKLNIIEGYAEAVLNLGYPIKTASVGDETHEASKKQLKGALKQLKKIGKTRVATFPNWIDFDIQEARWSLSNVQEIVEKMTDWQIAGLGVPKALITGVGGSTNRQTLVKQDEDYQREIDAIRNLEEREIRKEIFELIASEDEENLEGIPEFKWDLLGTSDRESKANRIVSYIKNGVITPYPKLAEHIRDIEGLPEPEAEEEESKPSESSPEDEGGDESE